MVICCHVCCQVYRCGDMLSCVLSGQSIKIKVSVQPTANYPIDLYYLMDHSYSMDDDLKTLKGQALNVCEYDLAVTPLLIYHSLASLTITGTQHLYPGHFAIDRKLSWQFFTS